MPAPSALAPSATAPSLSSPGGKVLRASGLEFQPAPTDFEGLLAALRSERLRLDARVQALEQEASQLRLGSGGAASSGPSTLVSPVQSQSLWQPPAGAALHDGSANESSEQPDLGWIWSPDDLGPQGTGAEASGRSSAVAAARSSTAAVAGDAASPSRGQGRLQKSRFAVNAKEEDFDETDVRESVLASLENFLKKQQSSVFVWGAEIFTSVVITLNAIFIAVEAEYMASHGGEVDPSFHGIHMTFNAIYLFELLLRVVVQRSDYFMGKEWRWNWLDSVLTLVAGLDIILTVSDSGSKAGRVLRGLRLVRLIRTLRLVRTLRAVREFHKMVYAVLSSMRTLVCSLLILFFVMYFFAILFTQGAAEAASEDREIAELPMYYGSLYLTFYTLFLACSNGISWSIVYTPLSTVHWTYGMLFMVYIALTLLGVMNVVNSVFVESAIMSAQHYRDLIIQETQHQREIAVAHMKEVFTQIDEDGSGEISAEEMEYFLTEPGLRRYVEALGISAENTRMLFRLLDQDDSKKIDLQEFCDGCLRLQGEAKSIDVHTMIYQVRQFLMKWSEFTAYVEERFSAIGEAMQLQQTSFWTAQQSYLQSSLATGGSVFSQLQQANGGSAFADLQEADEETQSEHSKVSKGSKTSGAVVTMPSFDVLAFKPGCMTQSLHQGGAAALRLPSRVAAASAAVRAMQRAREVATSVHGSGNEAAGGAPASSSSS